MLNAQFRDLSGAIDSGNMRDKDLPTKIITSAPVERVMTRLYSDVGSYFAAQAFRGLKLQVPGLRVKEDMENYWREEMESYARTVAGSKITSITEASREAAVTIIRRYLETSTDEGWGAEETARAIRSGLMKEGIELNGWRSLRIARTEVMTASNLGAMKGAESSDLPLVKYWISTYDDRTRDTHRVVEQQNPKEMNELFTVGIYQMNQPGDESGGPEEVINCRCTVAFEVKGFE
jgi:hypothetical protein